MTETSVSPKIVDLMTRQAVDTSPGRPLDNGGGPPHDGNMEARIAKLEAGAEYIQRDIKELKDDVRSIRTDVHSIRTTDFRLIFGALIAAVLGLAAIMAKGFHWI